MRTYALSRRLSHADVDFLGELKVSALLGLLEQAAVEASTDAGYDAARYAREGRLWIIRRTRLERIVPVGGTEAVVVETEVVDFRRARSLRRYTVRRDGIAVAHATTDWVYCDLRTGRPLRIPAALAQALTDGAGAPVLPRAEPLPALGPGAAVEFALTVQPSHLDHVAHVNNAVYAAWLEDGAFALFATSGWPLTRMLAAGGALRVSRLDCEYLTDALVGEHLVVRTWRLDGAAFEGNNDDTPPTCVQLLQTISRADDTAVLRARSDWAWRQQPLVVGGVPEP